MRLKGHAFRIADQDGCDNLLGRARQFEQYQPDADFALIATVLIHKGVSTHPLVDGNKRLAALLGGTFIHMNGKTLDMPEIGRNSAYELVMMPLVENRADLEAVASVIRANLHPLPY
jgi:prophage maintenance system killer protein